MVQILIVIRKGMLENVLSNESGHEYRLIDYDIEGQYLNEMDDDDDVEHLRSPMPITNIKNDKERKYPDDFYKYLP